MPERRRSAARSSTPSRVDADASRRDRRESARQYSRQGWSAAADIEPRHANRAAAHPPVRRQQRRCGFGRAGGEDDMLGLGVDQRGDRSRRASSIRRRAARPSPCTDDGLASTSSAASIAVRAAGKQRRACIVVEIGACCGHSSPNRPVIPPIRARARYFLEFARSAVLFTRFADGAVRPPSFEQF